MFNLEVILKALGFNPADAMKKCDDALNLMREYNERQRRIEDRLTDIEAVLISLKAGAVSNTSDFPAVLLTHDKEV